MLNRYDSENTHHWIDGYIITTKINEKQLMK